MAAISVRQASKIFGEEAAVQNVTFEVERGTIFGFIGPSGSGKTTTIRLLTGTYAPTAGDVRVLDCVPSQFTIDIKQRIGYMPQLFALYPDLTIWENLNFAASIYGMGYERKSILTRLLEFVELLPHKGKLARNVSGGMQRRLSLAATLVHHPDLIFLDEPTAGIDPLLRRKFWDNFQQMKSDGRTLFVTTQYVGETAYCDKVGLIARGRLIAVDTPTGLKRRAFGGDLLDLSTTTPLDPAIDSSLLQLAFVISPPQRLSENSVRLTVEDAGTAIPVLTEWLRERKITIRTIEKFDPSFDDAFIQLVQKEKE